MKKLILLLLAIGLAPAAANSQALIALVFGKKLETDRIKLGLFLGEQGSMITGANTTSFRPNLSFAVGAYTDIRIGKADSKWMLQNYLVFKAPKGGSGLDIDSEALTDDPQVLANTDMIERNITYFQITPVMRYCFTPVWSVGVGPYVGFKLAGNDIYSAKEADGDLSYKMKMTKKFTTVDFGFAFDVQCRLMKGNGLQLNLRWEQGTVDIYRKGTGLTGRNMAFHLGLGIPITKAKTPAPANKDATDKPAASKETTDK